MNKKFPLPLKIGVCLLLFFGVERFCHKQTQGFQLHKILSTQNADAGDPLPALSEEETGRIQKICSQPFYFLGKGGQSYAFISEDQKTVLKFFKNHHIRFWKFLQRVPLPLALEPTRQRILKSNMHQSPAFFESCKISYLELKERTGLIYLHLHKTDYFKEKLTIVDALGIAHQIDLDSIDFALQEKADFTKLTLKKMIRANDLDAAKECIDSILGLIVERSQKGIRDRDPNFRRNIGFIGHRAIEIDIGSYSKDESFKNAENFKVELLAKTQKFKKWLDRKHPGLSIYLSERTDQILQESERTGLR